MRDINSDGCFPFEIQRERCMAFSVSVLGLHMKAFVPEGTGYIVVSGQEGGVVGKKLRACVFLRLALSLKIG